MGFMSGFSGQEEGRSCLSPRLITGAECSSPAMTPWGPLGRYRGYFKQFWGLFCPYLFCRRLAAPLATEESALSVFIFIQAHQFGFS